MLTDAHLSLCWKFTGVPHTLNDNSYCIKYLLNIFSITKSQRMHTEITV